MSLLHRFYLPAQAPPNRCEELEMLSLEIAISEEGNGEDPELGNNRGEDVDRYRAGDGTGKGPGGKGAWCARFGSYCWVVAAAQLEPRARLPFATNRGAKRLARNIAAAGRRVNVEIEDPRPGMSIAWHNPRYRPPHPLSWRGHFARVREYDPHTDTLTSQDGNKVPRVGPVYHRNGIWRRDLAIMSTIIGR